MITITLLITVIKLIGMVMRLETWLKLSSGNYAAGSFGSNLPEVFHDKGVLKSFAKFTAKHLCQSLFFHNVAGLANSKFLRTSFIIDHLQWLLPKLLLLTHHYGKIGCQSQGKCQLLHSGTRNVSTLTYIKIMHDESSRFIGLISPWKSNQERVVNFFITEVPIM